MDSRLPTAQTVAVKDGLILEVGPSEIAAGYPNSDVVDLAGRLVMPGFVDAHHHLSVEALHPIWVDLSGATDAEAIVDRLRRAAELPGTGWLRGCQWDSTAPVRLTRDDLDAVGTDRPILVACVTFHRGLLSSAGMDALGLSPTVEDPPGGKYGRDARGAPNGFLRETAWGLAHAATIRSFGNPDRWGDLIAARCRELLRLGITAVHDTTVSASAAAVYAALASSGRLPISVLGFPHAEEILTGMDDAAWTLGPTGEGNNRYRTGPIKLFADGAPDFAIDACIRGRRIEAGILNLQMRDTMHRAFERGFSVAVHAMGNLGLRNTISAWQDAATASTPPLRIEHATLAGPNEVRELKRIGAAAVVQPAFIDLVGPMAARLDFDEETWLPFRDLDTAGVLMAASSDSPCSVSSPLLESSFGVTRRTTTGLELGSEQSLPFERWLEMYTAGGADAGDQADERGRLRSGLRADFVVLDGSLSDPSSLRVAETWVSGERVYLAEQVRPPPDPRRRHKSEHWFCANIRTCRAQVNLRHFCDERAPRSASGRRTDPREAVPVKAVAFERDTRGNEREAARSSAAIWARAKARRDGEPKEASVEEALVGVQRQLALDGARLLLARRDGVPAGFALFAPNASAIELYYLAVDPDAWGGSGERAPDRGGRRRLGAWLRRAGLWVIDDNQRAVAVYE